MRHILVNNILYKINANMEFINIKRLKNKYV